MKKFLLSLVALVVSVFAAQVDEVTLMSNASDFTQPTWTGDANKYETTVDGFSIVIDKAGSTTNLAAPEAHARIYQYATLTITAPEGVVMTKVTMTDVHTAATELSHAQFSEGWTAFGTLTKASTPEEFGATSDGLNQLTMTANKQIRVQTLTVTYQAGSSAVIVPTPKFTLDESTMTLTIAADGADAIYYTTDDTEPTAASTKYTAPFAVAYGATVKAVAEKEGKLGSVATFTAPTALDGFEAFIAANPTKTAPALIQGPITTVYQNGRNLYACDSKGAWMLIYNTNDITTDTYVNGDQLSSVTGYYSPYHSLPEMVPTAFGTKTAGTAVQPEELAIEELSLDMANKYVKVTGLTIEKEASDTTGKRFTATDGSGDIVISNTFTGNYYTNVEVPEGKDFTLVGFVCRNNDELQLTPVEITGGTVMEEVATPEFSVASGAVEAGTTVEITCATEGAKIYYTLDGNEPTAESTLYAAAIAINEDTTIKAIALKDGMLASQVATARYTIFNPDATEVTFDFTSGADFGVDTPENSKGVSLVNATATKQVVTLTISDKEGGSTEPRLYNSQGTVDLRLYKNQYITVTLDSNYMLETIVFENAGGSIVLTPDEGAFQDAEASRATTMTWKPGKDGVNTVKFTATATTRISSLDVVYAKTTDGITEIQDNDNEAPVQYFNLQGVRVANPANGLYIRVQGNKATKVLVK